ncbi:sensor histidine kinase [Myxococcota bacterium]|nr:sensor histidine kinase [Myxococcota bacterium]
MEHQLNAKFAAHIFDKHFNRIRREAEILARRLPLDDLRPLLQGRVTFTSIRRWREDSFLRELRPCIGAILLTTPSGEVLYSDPFSALKPDVTAQPWFHQLKAEGGLAMGGLEPFTPSRGFNFMNVTPIKGHRGALEGYLIMAVRSCILEPLLKEAAYFKPPHSTLLLTSPAKQIALYEGPAALGTIPRAFESIAPNETRELRFSGKAYLISRVPLGASGWTVFLQTEERLAYHHVHKLNWHLAVIVAVTFIVILLVADFIAVMFLRPIQELERGAKMIGSGALTYRIDLHSEEDNEIGRLAKAFNSMAINLEQNKQRLKNYSYTLESTNQELNALVFAISNNLTKHLTTISWSADILHEEYCDQFNDEDFDFLNKIKSNAESITALMENLLQFVNHEHVDGDVISFRVYDLLQEVIQANDIEGTIELIGEFPTMVADRKQWRLIFANLIHNGLKFNRSAAPKVIVECKSQRMHWIFEIKDNGIGIKKDDQKRVFQLFTRLNHQEDFPGTGTGLSLTSRLIEEHKGKLILKSKPGHGSLFTIRIPKKISIRTAPHVRLERLDPDA